MWYLISESSTADTKYAILGSKVYIVGRRDCDILVAGDASVSRKHAELSSTHPETNLTNTSKLPVLRLKDLSKFGTWVNKQKVEGERLLKDGDVIHFGSPSSSFKTVYEPLVVTTSCLDTAGKKSIRQTLSTLGGHMVNEWKQDCSLLIMNKISVTIKVICAMVSLKPIVTPAYMEAYLRHLQGTGGKPDPNLFIPELAETQVDPNDVSFGANERRKTIFTGKTFIFFSEKQLKKMSLALELAGGLPILMERKVDGRLLIQPETIVMTCPETDITKENQGLVAKATALLEKHGKHPIPDAEIGYAVLYCSTERHCNPDHVQDRDFSHLPSQSLSQMVPVASESQLRDNTSTPKVSSPSQKAARDTSPSAKVETQAKSEEHNGAQVRVKEEPLRARNLAQKKGQKRVREEEHEDETPAPMKRVKDEPVSPAPEPVKPCEKPSSRKKTPEPVWDSDDKIDYSKIDADISISSKTFPSNKTPSNSSTVSKSVRQDKPTGKDGTKKHGSKSRSRSPSPANSRNVATKASETLKDQNDNTQVSDTRRRSGSRSPHRIKQEEDGMSEMIPAQDSRLSPSRRETNRTANQGSENPEIRHNKMSVAETADKLEENEDTKSDIVNGAVPSGFLTTRKPIDTQIKRNEHYQEDAELPKDCVQIEFTSLLVKQVQPRLDRSKKACPDGYTRWKGKIVRNFKKFKKMQHSGCHGLPNIIGGSDLEVHQGERSKEMDDWFREALEAESQNATADRRAQDLFDYDPSTKRRGR